MIANQHNGRDILLDKLKEKQLNSGYVSEAFIAGVAKSLGPSAREVYGVSPF